MSASDPGARGLVRRLVAGVEPLDRLEAADRRATLGWVDSGAPLYRTAAPDRHLCVYIALVDRVRRAVLLVDHVKSGLWLLPGGHVDDGEDPRGTALREATEELGVAGGFHPDFGIDPLFLTVTRTRGAPSHTDVTFWFVRTAEESTPIRADPREAREARWFPLDDPLPWTRHRFDPQMHRFRAKLSRTAPAASSSA